jgi:rubrerythrin
MERDEIKGIWTCPECGHQWEGWEDEDFCQDCEWCDLNPDDFEEKA